MDERSDLGTWLAAVTLLAGLVAISLPGDSAGLIGSVVLVTAGVALVLVGIANLRWAVRLDAHDRVPALAGTVAPALAGGLLLTLGFHDTAALLALRGLGAVVACAGLAALVLPPLPVANALSRATGRRRPRRTAAVR
jgi:hypothetical protein